MINNKIYRQKKRAMKSRYHKLKAQGLCTRCGNRITNDRAHPNGELKSLCRDCGEDATQRTIRYQRLTK